METVLKWFPLFCTFAPYNCQSFLYFRKNFQKTFLNLRKETRERELDGIREAASLTGCNKMTIVTLEQEEEVYDDLGIIHIVPAWRWFLLMARM